MGGRTPIASHRVVLAARSPVFKAQLTKSQTYPRRSRGGNVGQGWKSESIQRSWPKSEKETFGPEGHPKMAPDNFLRCLRLKVLPIAKYPHRSDQT